jgi:hypothetical protein
MTSAEAPRFATVVNPASKVRRANLAPTMARSKSDWTRASSRWVGPDSWVRCTWLSMSPGSTNWLRRSTTRAPGAET